MKPLDLNGLKTYELRSRPSKVFVEDLGRPVAASAGVGDWLDALPRQLAANDLRKVRDHLCRARDDGRTIAAAIGGHVIKTGCSPYLIDWMQQGLLKSVSLNGAAAIHDFELAYAGKTSEDVGARLKAGKFGMARETADAFAVAALAGAPNETGLGARSAPTLKSNIVRIWKAVWFTRPAAPAFPAPSTSPSAPTSFTCTRTYPAPPWAKRR